MPNHYEGKLSAAGMRFGIVVSRFNHLITRRLLEGAEDALRRHGGETGSIDVAWVPGAFEVPVVARAMAGSGRYAAVICLGCLIQGATPHMGYLAGAVAASIQGIATETGVPCIFGVLTTESLEQALERAGGKMGNKGSVAAVTALETAAVLRQVVGEGG